MTRRDPLILELECHLKCPQCGGTPYHLYRRQVKEGSPVYENVLWGATPDIPPPLRPERILCPTCHVECRRATP